MWICQYCQTPNKESNKACYYCKQPRTKSGLGLALFLQAQQGGNQQAAVRLARKGRR